MIWKPGYSSSILFSPRRPLSKGSSRTGLNSSFNATVLDRVKKIATRDGGRSGRDFSRRMSHGRGRSSFSCSYCPMPSPIAPPLDAGQRVCSAFASMWCCAGHGLMASLGHLLNQAASQCSACVLVRSIETLTEMRFLLKEALESCCQRFSH